MDLRQEFLRCMATDNSCSTEEDLYQIRASRKYEKWHLHSEQQS